MSGATMAAVQRRMTSATHGAGESGGGTQKRVKTLLKGLDLDNRSGTATCFLVERLDASLKLCDALVLIYTLFLWIFLFFSFVFSCAWASSLLFTLQLLCFSEDNKKNKKRINGV